MIHPLTGEIEYEIGPTESVSMAVVAALSEAMDVAPLDMEPLQVSVDTDALDVLVHVRGTMNGDVQVTFTHERWAVSVHSYGVIAVTPPEHERTDDQSRVITHQ